MSDVLVDTSASVAFLRGEKHVVAPVDPLIAEDRVSIAGAVHAEVLVPRWPRPADARP